MGDPADPGPRSQFFCTMQAPPSARKRVQSSLASSRLSAPICTMYMERRPRLKFRTGRTKGSRPPSSATCARFSLPNLSSAFAFENEVDT